MCVLGHVCLRARDATWEPRLLFPEAGSRASGAHRDQAPAAPSHAPCHSAQPCCCLSCGSPGERAGVAPCFCPHHVPIQVFQDPFFRGARGHLGVSLLGSLALSTEAGLPPPWPSRAIGPQARSGGHRTPNLDQFCRLQEGRAPAEVLVAMPTHVSLAVVQKRDACLCLEVPPGFPLCPRLGWSLTSFLGRDACLPGAFPVTAPREGWICVHVAAGWWPWRLCALRAGRELMVPGS